MTSASPERVEIVVDATQQVSGLLQVPGDARACCVLAHGAGAGMAHPFMAAVANGLAERGIATLRYQFPYMERGSKRPDPPKLAHATVRAAVDAAAQRLPGMPLVAGGKSFGGRMTSQAQAAAPLRGVRGIVFISWPGVIHAMLVHWFLWNLAWSCASFFLPLADPDAAPSWAQAMSVDLDALTPSPFSAPWS